MRRSRMDDQTVRQIDTRMTANMQQRGTRPIVRSQQRSIHRQEAGESAARPERETSASSSVAAAEHETKSRTAARGDSERRHRRATTLPWTDRRLAIGSTVTAHMSHCEKTRASRGRKRKKCSGNAPVEQRRALKRRPQDLATGPRPRLPGLDRDGTAKDSRRQLDVARPTRRGGATGNALELLLVAHRSHILAWGGRGEALVRRRRGGADGRDDPRSRGGVEPLARACGMHGCGAAEGRRRRQAADGGRHCKRRAGGQQL